MQRRLLFETIVFFVKPKMPILKVFRVKLALIVLKKCQMLRKYLFAVHLMPSWASICQSPRTLLKKALNPYLPILISDLALKTFDFPGTLTVSDCSYQLSTLSMVVKSKNMSFFNFNDFSLNLNDFSTCSCFLWHVIFPNKDLNKRKICTR